VIRGEGIDDRKPVLGIDAAVDAVLDDAVSDGEVVVGREAVAVADGAAAAIADALGLLAARHGQAGNRRVQGTDGKVLRVDAEAPELQVAVHRDLGSLEDGRSFFVEAPQTVFFDTKPFVMSTNRSKAAS
jgi:hypothetical protein